MSDLSKIKIKILDKEYDIACKPDERTELLDSSELLNKRLREIRDSGKVIGLDRIAIMAALNLAHDVVKLQNKSGQLDTSKDDELSRRVRTMRQRIKTALGQEAEQMDLA